MKRLLFATLVVVGLLSAGRLMASDPLLDSWLTLDSSKYARLYQTPTDRTNGNAVTTWSGQTLPVYADVQSVLYSASWVYVKSSGLAGYNMGPWLNPMGGQFMFWPTNQHHIHRFPRVPAVPAGSKSTTPGGYSGIYVNGVAIFNALDGMAWSGSAMVNGPHTMLTHYWHRNAPVGEAFNFDGGLGHQPPTAIYHTHQNPIAIRYQLGDHVDYNATTKLYSESTGTVTKHSPIIGWAHDGYPIYGPYGYGTATNTSSGVRRMTAGYVKRDGSNGTDSVASNLSVIPAWYARFRQKLGATYSTSAATARPSISSTYPLGTFAEDWAYLGDLGYTQGTDFDLDQYNCRYCFTPEFPGGTYAYFTALDSSTNATFPYVFGYEFYGNATGGTVTSISESVTTYFIGGTNVTDALKSPVVNPAAGSVTLTWSAVEGGSYVVRASSDLQTWTNLTGTVTATNNLAAKTETGVTGNSPRFYRTQRSAVAAFDP